MELLVRPSDRAQAVLDQYWDRQLPVDLKFIAHKSGATVLEKTALPYSGCFKYENGKPLIYVNSSQSKMRQRFTLAHELGHYHLGHQDALRDLPENFSTNVFDPRESAANQFAAALLMPKLAIHYLLSERKVKDISELARLLETSEVAMRFRLKKLGITS